MWRAHSCVPRRHACRRLLPQAQKRRVETRRGTQECARHGNAEAIPPGLIAHETDAPRDNGSDAKHFAGGVFFGRVPARVAGFARARQGSRSQPARALGRCRRAAPPGSGRRAGAGENFAGKGGCPHARARKGPRRRLRRARRNRCAGWPNPSRNCAPKPASW